MNQWIRATSALVLCVGLTLLAGCGGGGGGGEAGNSGAGGSNAGTTPTNQLFVTEITHGTVAMFAQVNPSAGASLAAQSALHVQNLDGALAYDKGRDLLYVSSPGIIQVYATASALATGAAPTRTVALPADILFVTSLQLDEAADVLYVGADRRYDGVVLVFGNASTAAGAVAPTRTMVINDGVTGFAIDTTHAILYASAAVTGVHVYTGVDTANGIITPARHMLLANTVTGLALDAGRDRLYVADVFNGVHIIGGASTTAPSTDTLVAIPNARVVAVDPANDRLYVGAYDKAYLLSGASALGSGTSAPAVAVAGPAGSSIGGFAFP